MANFGFLQPSLRLIMVKNKYVVALHFILSYNSFKRSVCRDSENGTFCKKTAPFSIRSLISQICQQRKSNVSKFCIFIWLKQIVWDVKTIYLVHMIILINHFVNCLSNINSTLFIPLIHILCKKFDEVIWRYYRNLCPIRSTMGMRRCIS